MKRIILLVLTVCLILSGCSKTSNISSSNPHKTVTVSSVWLTYSEINSLISSPVGFEAEFSNLLSNLINLKIQNVFVHIRSHCDSIFVSSYFPITENAQKLEFDILEYMVNQFHNNGIKVHAWINPYRVTTSHSDISLLNQNSPAFKWLNDQSEENDKNVCIMNGIYLNPAEPQVRELIINGIKEVLNNYNVDGIHFDDYFYPTTDSAFDLISFAEYKESNTNPLSLDDWRRCNVNLLISSCYSAIKNINENVLFTVSPAASLEKNYNELYADIKYWCSNGYIDWIIPQLYFGFDYPDKSFRFNILLDEWKKIRKLNENVELHIGLATYKIGTTESAEKEEWNENTNIIARQAEICLNDNSVNGYVFFSYSSLFGNQPLQILQRQTYQEKMSGLK